MTPMYHGYWRNLPSTFGEHILHLWHLRLLTDEIRLSRVGDNRHVMTYIIGSGRSFNMVLNYADHSNPADWSEDKETLLKDMRKEFEGWDPVYVDLHCLLSLSSIKCKNNNNQSRLSKIIHMIDRTMKWPLYSGSVMRRWVSGKLVVLGDAAHAMVPYMSQGNILQ